MAEGGIAVGTLTYTWKSAAPRSNKITYGIHANRVSMCVSSVLSHALKKLISQPQLAISSHNLIARPVERVLTRHWFEQFFEAIFRTQQSGNITKLGFDQVKAFKAFFFGESFLGEVHFKPTPPANILPVSKALLNCRQPLKVEVPCVVGILQGIVLFKPVCF